MARKTISRNISITIPIVTTVILLSMFPAYSLANTHALQKSDFNKGSLEILKEIYLEVLELGNRDGEDFLKREFLMNLDRNDTNKEEHVVVLSQTFENKRTMVLQVTYFEPKKSNHFIKYAKTTRRISCDIEESDIKVKENDYNEKEIKPLLKEILKGIKNKKKLLELIRHKS